MQISNTGKKRIYICGKVTGEDREVTVIKFANAENCLRRMGWEAINPVRQISKDTEWKQAMRICIKELVQCDAIYMLPCWPKSRGAILERYLAGHLGIEIIDAKPINI